MDTPASGATEAPDDGAIRRISDFVTDRPVAIAMVFIAAVVFGIFSYRRLPVTLMPELSYPTLTVRTEYPGAAPEEVENDVTRPLEEALGVIGGLRRISSVSRAGVSDVVLEFGWDIAMSDAIQDTLEKMDLVFLPTEAERPLILRFDPSLDPMMELSMSGDGVRYEGEQGLRRVRRIAELQVKRALEPVKGVAAVRIRGGLEEEINVNLSRDQLRRAGLAIDDVIRRLEQENINVAGGTLTEGRTEYMVRTLNEYTDLEQMADTIVTMREGRQVRIRDLGTVTWGHKERQITTRTDGRESVQLEIFKEADANIVALAERIRTRLGDFDPDTAEPAAEAPPRRGPPGRRNTAEGLAKELWTNEGLRIQVVADRSVFIASSVAEVRNTALYGGLLAILVLFLFLRQVRPTLIIAISIPISLLVTFAPLNLLGVSLNIMSLGGLALGIGMLVDSSIVVLESISRCREEGDDLRAAALRGTSEVRMAVIASTFTSIAVFAPMVFVHGVAGQAFGDLGLAVVISLLAALVVALLLIPMLASREGLDVASVARNPRELLPIRAIMLAVADYRHWGWIARILWTPYIILRTVLGLALEIAIGLILGIMLVVFLVWHHGLAWIVGRVLGIVLAIPALIVDRILGWSQDAYPKVVARVTSRPSGVLLMAGLCLAATVMLFRGLPSELLPEVHQGEFTFEVALPVGTPLEITDEVLSPVADAILAEREHIEALIVTLGFDPTTSQRSDEGEHSARFKVILDSADPATEAAVVDRLRRRFVELPDTNARVVRPVLFSFKTPIEVEVHGENLIELRRQAERVRSVMASLPELADVETTQRAGAPEVQIRYDRDQLARYDLNVSQVAARVRDSVKGSEATLYNLGDRRVPVMVRFREADRALVTQVSDFVVNPGADRPIPLSSVAEVDLAEGPAEVRRVDGRRVALVTANVAQGSLGGAVAAVENALNERVEWPADMTFFIAGQNQEWQQSQSSLMLALALSVFLVYVIMAMQFESLVQPFVIMLTIPLAFLGTGLALHALELSLSVVVFLGMIMLAGIVVNNAIVFIDYINTLRGRGMERDEAVVTAGSVRLRPILMTTATTVLGLLPMALGFGDGAELRAPMAVAVISGLVASTLLTLIIIPAVYVVFDRALDRFRASEPHPAEEPA
jgi:HAE1 family hydrophobic/amphiphilic exporter-1